MAVCTCGLLKYSRTLEHVISRAKATLNCSTESAPYVHIYAQFHVGRRPLLTQPPAYSILDSIRSARPARAPAPGRELADLQGGVPVGGRVRRRLRHHPLLRARPAQNHEPRMAGDDQRVSQGVSLPFLSLRPVSSVGPRKVKEQYEEAGPDIGTCTTQRENMEPITGISSEGYKGKGAIQSPPRGFKFEKTQSDDDDDE